MALLGNLKGSAQAFQDTEFYNGVILNSVRLNGSDTHFRRTLSESGSRRKATWSFWLKHDTKKNSIVYSKGNNVAYADAIYFEIRGNSSGSDFYSSSTIDDSQTSLITTTRKFRDSSAWYHFVIAFDTEQGTASDRMKLYINGVQETAGTFTYPSQNTDMAFGWYGSNSGNDEVIGDYDANESSNHHINGCLAEFHYIDGTQLTPTSFGEFKNGIWIPKEYTGSHGTIGYHLKFDQTGTGTASSSTVGADSSGNNNHFTSSGIAAHDCNFPDTPENNFSTLNSLIKPNGALTFSEGNLKVGRGSEDAYSFAGSTIGVKTGKWYAEWSPQGSQTAGNHMVGISESNIATLSTGDPHLTNGTIWYHGDGAGHVDGTNQNASTFSSSTSYGDNDKIGVALDLDSGTQTVKFYKNGSLVTTKNLTANFTDHIVFANNFFNTNNGIWNFGQDSSFAGNETAQGNTDGNGIGDFYYAPPSGYLALCSANLPEPTISPNADTQADDHFNTVIYSGTGNADTITTGLQPDWIWIKTRNVAGYHNITDTSRGITRELHSNVTDAETNYSRIASTSTTGFTFESGANGYTNESGSTFVSWNWHANGGTTSSNSDGTITSTVQANTTAGFSIVTYTGSGSSGSFGHGLTSPKIVLIKDRDSTNIWYFHTTAIDGSDDYLVLNTDGYKENASSGYSIGNLVYNFGGGGSSVNVSGRKYVAYCFAEIEGYSKFGSYTGNGSSDGVFVFTGFRPAWVMFKGTDSATQWLMKDSVRSPENPVDERLRANLSDAENTGADVDFLSNGFKARHASNEVNANGTSYIYMAFAEAPFKYANGR